MKTIPENQKNQGQATSTVQMYSTPTVLDLYTTAPEGQKTRCKFIMKAIAQGEWENAEFTLRNASNETTGEWSENAKKLAEFCKRQKA